MGSSIERSTRDRRLRYSTELGSSLGTSIPSMIGRRTDSGKILLSSQSLRTWCYSLESVRKHYPLSWLQKIKKSFTFRHWCRFSQAPAPGGAAALKRRDRAACTEGI